MIEKIKCLDFKNNLHELCRFEKEKLGGYIVGSQIDSGYIKIHNEYDLKSCYVKGFIRRFDKKIIISDIDIGAKEKKDYYKFIRMFIKACEIRIELYKQGYN